MNRSLPVLLAALCAAAGVSHAPVESFAARIALADSTVCENWTLPNGLRVVTRHVPLARHVDVTVAYGFGRDDDPPEQPGLATLVAHLHFYGPTAEAPGRTRDEMRGQRPAGWDLVVSPRVTRFSELATVDQFPGVLHQVAVRMRGVTVTPARLRGAVAAVRAELDTTYRAVVDRALYHGVRELAEGAGTAGLAEAAAGHGLSGFGLTHVQRSLRDAFAPANAVLSIAGNLSQVPVRTLVENEFGGIPGGARLPASRPAPLDSGTFVVARSDLSRSAGVVGVTVPALDDSTHPAFYLHLLLVGAHCSKRWGPPAPPLASRFQYSLFDDPRMARFYPPIDPATKDPLDIAGEFVTTMGELTGVSIPGSSYDALWRGVDWLLGGPATRDMMKRLQHDPAALHALSTGMAVRELWGGEAFWSVYRQRFQQAIERPYTGWYQWLTAPGHRVQLLFAAKR